MSEDIGAGGEDRLECRGVAVAIGDQHLHSRARAPGANRGDGLRERGGPTVAKVIARDTGDDGVLQTHRAHRVGNPFGLAGVDG